MRTIKVIVEKIKDEIEDVENYVRLALHNKEDDVDAYNTYMSLADDEYNHAMRLHDLVTREIGKARKILAEKGEKISPYMLEAWNDEHDYYIEKMSKLKYEIELAKKGKSM